MILPENFDFGKAENDIVSISEADKVLYCAMPKTGCTKMINLFLRLAGNPDWIPVQRESFGAVHKSFNEDKTMHFWDLSEEIQLESVSSSDWIRAVVLRDPIERFMSGYLHKTVTEGLVGPYWVHDVYENEEVRDSLDMPPRFNATAASLKQFFRLKGLWAFDGHFNLQRNRCGFSSLPENFYNRFFIYSEHLNLDDATSALFDRRVDHAIYEGWDRGSLWALNTSHVTRGSPMHRKLVAELCADPDALKLVVEYTRPDYEFFGFPPPKLCDEHSVNVFVGERAS